MKEAISKAENLIIEAGWSDLDKRSGFHAKMKRKYPMNKDAEPETVDGELCNEFEHTLYMQLIGIYNWEVTGSDGSLICLNRIEILKLGRTKGGLKV